MTDNAPKTFVGRVAVWVAKAIATAVIASLIGAWISDHYAKNQARIDAFQRLAGLRFQTTKTWGDAGCSAAEFYIALNEAIVVFNYSEDIRNALGLLDEDGISDADALPFALAKIANELNLGPLDTATLRSPLAPERVTC